MRHERLRTLPSAWMTSGANSIPNLLLVSIELTMSFERQERLTFGVLQRPPSLQIFRPSLPDHRRTRPQ